MQEQKGCVLGLLGYMGRLFPSNYLKTAAYLNLVYKPRKLARIFVSKFYRMDHIYEVIQEFESLYKGNFSILEFGVADGYSFVKLLYAVRYLGMEDRVTVHGFDTFEGLPKQTDSADDALVEGYEWKEGHYSGRYEDLTRYCERKYDNFALHKGLFQDTINGDVLNILDSDPPILIWVDCDYYSSARSIFERLIPYIPTGCVVYFDDIYFNYGSRFTGERRLVWEVNHGEFGDGVELVLDSSLSWDSSRVYRFINPNCNNRYELVNPIKGDPVRYRRNDSPFP